MQGLLRRLFAPRWQHPSSNVRRRALEQLDPDRPEDRRGLEALTRDSHADIRLAALCALDDLPGLAQAFAERPDDDAWREALIARLCGRDGQSPLDARQRQVEQLDDARLLRDVAFQGDNLDLRLAALARLDDESDLIEQACHNRVATVRHRAAQRVSSEAGLKRLLKESRRDRQVAQRAREHLNRLKADAQWVRDQQQRRDALLQQLESLARSVWEPHYQARLRHLQKEWEALAHPPGSDAEARYQHAVTRAEKTLHDHAAEEHAREQHQQRQRSAEDERETLLVAFENSLDELCQGQAPSAQNFASLRAQRRLAGQQWQSLSDIHPPDEPARQRYARAMKRYERYGAAWQRYLDAADGLQDALDNADSGALTEQAGACQWPDELPLPPLLAQARRQAQQQDAPRTDAEPHTLGQELGTLEQHLERGEFNEASRLHQQLKPRVQALRGPDSESLQARLRQLGARLAELRDWRGFVAGPKREQLCTSIETLADNADLTDTALDRRHRQLVKEWKALGDAAATREMSHRFRAASDRIHQRLKPWRESLDQQRSANLAAREALCEQLEMLLEQPADNADPDALRQIRDRSRYQWREYSPVPRQHSEAVGRRFGRARHRLQALIDRRARDIAAQKRALVEQAQALEHSTEPLDTRIAKAKALQQEWRQLGRAPKGEEKPLWRTFRRACDRLFAARDAHRTERAERQQQRLDAMQALLDRMDAWQPQGISDAPTLEAFIQEAEALEPLPRGRRSDGMRKRLTGIIRARRERLDQLETDAVITRWQQSVPLLNAHLAADQAALDGEAVREVDAAQALDAPLFERFTEAHRQRNANRHAASHFDARAQKSQRDSLARLRVHLSLLATGQVRQSDEPLRLAIQVERLNEGLGMGHERSTADELGRLLAELLALGPMPRELWDANVNDFDALVHQLSGGQGNEASAEHKDV